MADEVVRLLLEAQNKASAEIRKLTGDLSALPGLAGKVTAAFGGFTAIAGSLAAVGAAAFVMSKRMADQAEQLDTLTAQTGVASDRLQAYRRVIELAGADPDILSKPFTQLNRSIATNDPLLAKLGVTSRDTGEAFQQLVHALAQSDDVGKQTEAATRLMGAGAAQLVGHFKALDETSADVLVTMRQTGELMEGGPLKAARALDSQMDRLDRNWRGALNRISSATLPWVEDTITAFNNLWDAISGNKADTVLEIDQKMLEYQRAIEKAEAARTQALERQKTGLFNVFDPADNPQTQIDFQTRRINTLTKAIEDLARARRELTGVTDADRLRSIHGSERARLGPLDTIDFSTPGRTGGRTLSGDRLFIPPRGLPSGLDSLEQQIETLRVFRALVEETDKPLNAMVANMALLATTTGDVNFDQVAKDLRKMEIEVRALNSAVDVASNAILSTFHAWELGAAGAADRIRNEFRSAFQDIAGIAVGILTGLGLQALGVALGGPVGGFVARVGGRLAGAGTSAPARSPASGNTIIINTLDTRTLRQELMPGGALHRAQDQVRIGSRY